LNQLTKESLLIFNEGKDYYPARAPSTITVREIVEAVSGAKLLAPPTGEDLVSRELKRKFEEASDRITATLDGLNLQELITGDNRQEHLDPEADVK